MPFPVKTGNKKETKQIYTYIYMIDGYIMYWHSFYDFVIDN